MLNLKRKKKFLKNNWTLGSNFGNHTKIYYYAKSFTKEKMPTPHLKKQENDVFFDSFIELPSEGRSANSRL